MPVPTPPKPSPNQISKFPSCRSQGPPFSSALLVNQTKAQQLALLGPQVVKMLGHREKRPDPGEAEQVVNTYVVKVLKVRI